MRLQRHMTRQPQRHCLLYKFESSARAPMTADPLFGSEHETTQKELHYQGVVTYIPAALTPATGIKILSGPFLDLDCLIAPLKEP